MDRLISERAVLGVINEAIRTGRFYYGKNQTIKEIKAIPPAEPRYYPPCEDCNTKMYEIRKAYDKVSAYNKMTNGDVIKDNFPKAKIRWVTETQIGITYYDNQSPITVYNLEWWNSPYSEGK